MASSLPPPPGFLLRTGQRWRYELPAAGFIACGVGLMLGGGRRSPLLLALAIANFSLMCLWARCPRCRSAVVWRVLTRTSVWRWMSAVVDLRQCPACRFEGLPPDTGRSPG